MAFIKQLGTIDISLLSETFGNIQTSEIIITNERLQHIYERHPEDYNLFKKYGQSSVQNPDIIIKDEKNQGTIFMVKKITRYQSKCCGKGSIRNG